jgi:hypothetical protein
VTKKLAALLVLAVLAVPAAGEPAWKFVVMSDSQGQGADNTEGVSIKALSTVLTHVLANAKPEVILFTGDLVQGAGTAEGLEKQLMTFRRTMAPAWEAKVPVLAVRGSHDTGDNNLRPWANEVWTKVFSGPYAMPANGPAAEKGLTYSHAHKNAFFLGLDGYKTLNDMKLTLDLPWVKAQLAANRRPHVFAFSHTQIKKVEHSESLDNVPAMRNELVAMLRAGGSRAYFCGHMHVSNHTRFNDTAVDPGDKSPDDDFHQFIVPPCSSKFYSWNARRGYDGHPIPGLKPFKVHHIERRVGYVVVEVDGAKVTVSSMLIGRDGQFAQAATFSYTLTPAAASRPAP